MNSLKNFERMLYSVESNDKLFYPDISSETFIYMDVEASRNRSKVMCFPYYLHVGERAYIAIYIWDVLLPEGYKRFVIERGYSLNTKDEEMFITYLSDNIQVDCELYDRLVEQVKRDYPDVHLTAYEDIRHTLLHLYYTFHRTGPREILYKANLNYLAAGLEKIDGYNLIGSTPQKIFDVQLGMLRALNSEKGITWLKNSKNRKIANGLYTRYHNVIRGTDINEYQWRYMKEQEFYGQDIDKHMFRYLGEVVSDKQYYSYLKYLEQKDIVDEYYSLLPKYPSKGEMEQSFFVCDMIESYIEHENTIDYKLGQKAKIYQNIYTYETRDYVILVPSSLRELLTESQNQHNCLYRYVLRMAYDNTVILFMRDKKNQSQSLISIEVIDDMIIQALGTYNCRPDEKQNDFLNEYASIKHLTFLSEEDFD